MAIYQSPYRFDISTFVFGYNILLPLNNYIEYLTSIIFCLIIYAILKPYIFSCFSLNFCRSFLALTFYIVQLYNI